MKIVIVGLFLLVVCSGAANGQDDSLAGSFLSGKYNYAVADSAVKWIWN